MDRSPSVKRAFMPKIKSESVAHIHIDTLPDALSRRKFLTDAKFVKTNYTGKLLLKRKSDMKNGKGSKRMKKNENASGDQLTSANSQMQLFGLVGQTVNDSDRMLDENSDHVEDTFVVLDEKTKNKNLFTVTADLPANVAANIVIGEVIVPEFIETATLSEDSNHFL